MDWYTLKFLPDNKFVKYVVIWLFFLPIVLKILSKYEINIPLNWYCLFLAALCFTIGNVIYLFGCPKIIKDHIAFTGFWNDGKTYLYLKKYKEEILSNTTLASNKNNNVNDLKNDFWKIHKEAEFYRPSYLWWCKCFYILGFICIVIAIVFQTIIVISSYDEVVQQLQRLL
jgi:predicted membrane channel-forming protein YqfA (hemolysin III family)